MFSPQARGWTSSRFGPSRRPTVFPAGAGMDRPHYGESSARGSFPRRRGDGPGTFTRYPRPRLFSPQARGWTSETPPPPESLTVFPAGAGMDLPGLRISGASRSFPRRRGDGPLPRPPPAGRSRFSPQARGWTPGGATWHPGGGVFPAGAGMDRLASAVHKNLSSFPRRRGDGPPCGGCSDDPSTFSPQARGWTRLPSQHLVQGYVFPAGAGMDPVGFAAEEAPDGFPRRRGDGPWPPRWPRPGVTFSPQARGWTAFPPAVSAAEDVFPAGAGMDPFRSSLPTRALGFPRRRGDGPCPSCLLVLIAVFSPQARGWTVAGVSVRTGFDVFPAGAGMDPFTMSFSGVSRCFPRRRGDGPLRT